MAQISKKFIKNDAVDGTKIRLSNNEYLRSRNAADSADVNALKVNASDRIEFASIPQVSSDASAGNDLVRYSQVQALLEGLKPKEAVRVASIGANVVIASELENGDSLDGITLATGDRVLLKDQSTATENGIYIVSASGAAARSSDMNASSEFPGSYTVQTSGSGGNQGKAFVCTVASSFALGTDSVTYVLFKSTAIVTGHDMITLSGTELSVDLAAVSGLESSSAGNAGGQLRVKLESSNPSMQIDGSNQLGVKLNAAGAIASGASGLAAQVDNSTIEINTNALRVKDAGITAAKLAAAVAGDMIAGGAGTALSVDLAAVSGLESSSPGNTAGQLRVKLEASNPSIQIDGSNQLGVKIDTARGLSSGASGLGIDVAAAGALEFSTGDLAVKIEASNPSLQISSNELGVKFSATASGLEKVAAGLKVKLEGSNPTLQISGSSELGVKLADGLVSSASGISVDAFRQAITLVSGDITAQFVEITGGNKLIPETAKLSVDGVDQRYGIDWDIDNSGAQSKIRFDSTNLPSSDLRTGGTAALVATDVLYINGIRI